VSSERLSAAYEGVVAGLRAENQALMVLVDRMEAHRAPKPPPEQRPDIPVDLRGAEVRVARAKGEVLEQRDKLIDELIKQGYSRVEAAHIVDQGDLPEGAELDGMIDGDMVRATKVV
jgi:hypothetical protein